MWPSLALAALAGSAAPAERVIELRAGDRLRLAPGPSAARGSGWIELAGPDLVFPGGSTRRARPVVRPSVPGRYRLAFVPDPAAPGRYETVTVIDVLGRARPSAALEGPGRAGGGEAVRLAAELRDGTPRVAERRARWRQLVGPSVTLVTDARSTDARFRADGPGLYVFAASLACGGGWTPWAVHSMSVPARPDGGPERRPGARLSAPRRAVVGDEVLLDGSRSADPDGDRLVYEWAKLTGPPGDLVGGGPRVRFFPALTGQYDFGLVVADPAGLRSTPATVTVEVVPPPEPARPDPRARDPLDRPFTVRLEDRPLSELFARLSDIGVTVRASEEVTGDHPFDATTVDIWVVDVRARRVLDWVGRFLGAFYVIEEPGAVWFARGTRWLEREEPVVETYRIDALHLPGDASALEELLRESVRAVLWAGSSSSLGEADLDRGTLSAILPPAAQRRVAAIVAELRREVPSGASPRRGEVALGRLMRRSVRVRYENWPLRDAAWDLARQARVPVGFMPTGPGGGPCVTLDLGDVTFREALEALATAARMGSPLVESPASVWLPEGEAPPETSECAWSAAEVRSHDLTMLRDAHGISGKMALHLVRSRVFPSRWRDPFVALGACPARDRLVVIHTPEVQRAVAEFLSRLTRGGEESLDERGAPPRAPPP